MCVLYRYVLVAERSSANTRGGGGDGVYEGRGRRLRTRLLLLEVRAVGKAVTQF